MQLKKQVLKIWIPAFAGMTGFALCMLLSMEMAQATPPPCYSDPIAVKLDNGIKLADLIVIAEPATSPPQLLPPDPLDSSLNEVMTVKKVLKGSYEKPTIQIYLGESTTYGTNPGSFSGAIGAKVVLPLLQETDPKTNKITYTPTYPSISCGGELVEVEGNNVLIKDNDKTQRLSLEEFAKQYITK